MIRNSLIEIKEIIANDVETYGNIALLTHKNPDGDGLCACLAMQAYYEAKGYKIDIVLEKEAPDTYDYLQGRDNSIPFNDSMNYDLVIMLDAHEKNRAGICGVLFDRAKKVITLDHHEVREVFENSENYINPSYVSVGAIVFDLFFDEVKEMVQEVQDLFNAAVYTTILNDTGNFVNANTDAKTFEICRKMTESGFKPGPVSESYLLNRSADEMIYVGEVLSTIRTFDNEKHLFFHTTQEMLQRHKLSEEQTASMTTWLKGTKNVIAMCFMREVSENRYRLSLRSNFYNVNQIAVKFGGGGHTKASGCELVGTMSEIQTTILELFREQMND